jgi:hypothetical protein
MIIDWLLLDKFCALLEGNLNMKRIGRDGYGRYIQGSGYCVIGLLCNKFVLEAMFSTDGRIASLAVNLGIIVLQAALIGTGLLILAGRERYLPFIGVGLLLLFVAQFWVRVLLEIPFPERRMFAALPKPPTLFEAGFAYQDQISRYEARFAGLKTILPASGTVGYVTSEQLPPEEAKFHWGLTTYALVPVQVAWTANHTLIVGNFPDLPDDAAAPTIEGASLVKNFGNGVMLFVRKEVL